MKFAFAQRFRNADPEATGGGAPAAPEAPPAVPETTIPASQGASPPDATQSTPADTVASLKDYGHPGLNVSIEFMTKAGVAEDDPAVQAALRGEGFELLEAKLATLGDKARGWEAHLNLARKSIADIQQQETDKAKAVASVLHETFGGEQQWLQAREWAQSNLPDDQKQEVNALLRQGGLAAKMAASYLREQFSGQTSQPPAKATAATAPATSPASTGALSPREYGRAVSELASRIGNTRLQDHPEYAALQQRRLAWRG